MKKKDKYLIAGGAALLLVLLSRRAGATAAAGGSSGSLATLSYLGQSGLPLGMSRNNPGNIIRGIGYKGEVFQDNGRFAQFQSWSYGIRAMISLLKKYITSGSNYPNKCVTTPQNTVRLIITQWAPPTTCGGDNSPAAVANYIAYVAANSGVNPDTKLTADQNTLRKLVIAMSHFEQGRACVTPEQFNYAYTLL